ncbi:MAG: threonine/serine dehydratase [Gemmatimonadaceae bacterium]
MLETLAQINPENIARTEREIRPYIRNTPIIATSGSDFGLDCGQILFKLELFQHAGSFKARGAFANLLSRKIPKVGVAAASGGNHGLAVAHAAHKLGIPAKIFVPSVASPVKIEMIRRYGADLVIAGDRYADALVASKDWSEKSGALQVHAYDSIETLLGQATLGLELDQQAQVDTVLIAVGGGGLVSGVAAYFADRIASGKIKIVGVEPLDAPTLTYALRAGAPTDSPAGGIAADSLAPQRVGDLVFPIARDLVSEVVLVTDDEIRQAQSALWEQLRVVAEPGGAAAFAGVLSGKYRPQPEERVAVIVCGGNTTAVDFSEKPAPLARSRTSGADIPDRKIDQVGQPGVPGAG